jgi:hypothetical protein
MSDEQSPSPEDLSKLGLDFGDVNMRAEAVREDGSFVWSNLSAFGQRLADKSARNPRAWKQDGGGFNPFDIPGKRGPRSELTAYDEAIEKMFAPQLLEFRS